MRYLRPGAYTERVDATRVEPIVLRTDIAAFVGIAQRGPLDTPVPIESQRQFAAHFGDFTGAGYLAYAVRAFFDNGGRRCWVTRVASRDFGAGEQGGAARAASTTLEDDAGHPALRVTAYSPGSYGNGLTLDWAASGAIITASVPAQSTPQYAAVVSAAGFAADELVRIEQPGIAGPARLRIVAAVEIDPPRLHWVHPDPARRRDTDLVLAGVDPLVPLRITRIAYAVTVREGGSVVAHYGDVHLPPAHPRSIARALAAPRYPASRLGRSAIGIGREPGAGAPDDLAWPELPRAPEPIVVTSLSADLIPRPLAEPLPVGLALAGGLDGLLTLSADDFIGEPAAPGDGDFARDVKTRGIETFALVDEIALIAVPDILIQPDPDPEYLPAADPPPNPCLPCPPPAPRRAVHQPRPAGELPPVFPDAAIARVQSALIEHCERAGDRVAILALPYRIAASSLYARTDIVAWRERFDARCAALYAPWIEVAEPRGTAPTRTIPPCGHVIGAIARTDLAIGVQRAPANIDLTGMIGTRRAIDDALHGELNDANVNVVRASFGRIASLGGARTLCFDPQFRYLNIVRLLLAIKKASDLIMRWAVFEPNHETTYAGVTSALGAMLRVFFERGAFAGDTPEESYFIRCDATVNPPDARDRGELVALVGIAPVAPAEFIVVRVGRQQTVPLFSLFTPEEAQA